MAFALLPAIDVANGESVRLVQGATSTATAHGDPLVIATAWQAEGTEWIHLVDLDAAFGRGSNIELLTRVIDQLDVKVQLSTEAATTTVPDCGPRSSTSTVPVALAMWSPMSPATAPCRDPTSSCIAVSTP